MKSRVARVLGLLPFKKILSPKTNSDKNATRYNIFQKNPQIT